MQPDDPRTGVVNATTALTVGAALAIVKWGPDGTERTRYPGAVIETGLVDDWLVARAQWTTPEIHLDGLRFVPGDRLHEFFSPTVPFNAFSVFAPDGTLRGWYANVTYPTILRFDTDPVTLVWHDLWVDLIALPDGSWVIRDEDELEEAGIRESDPALHAMIVGARDEMVARWLARSYPFHEVDRR